MAGARVIAAMRGRMVNQLLAKCKRQSFCVLIDVRLANLPRGGDDSRGCNRFHRSKIGSLRLL